MSALASGMVVLLQLRELHGVEELPDLANVLLQVGVLFWIGVWILTIIVNLNDRIDHMMTLLVNSIGLPGAISVMFHAVHPPFAIPS